MIEGAVLDEDRPPGYAGERKCATMAKPHELHQGVLVEADFGLLKTTGQRATQQGFVVGPSAVPKNRPPGDFPHPEEYRGRFTVNFGSLETPDYVACRPEILRVLGPEDVNEETVALLKRRPLV